jgi:hypothetical protein
VRARLGLLLALLVAAPAAAQDPLPTPTPSPAPSPTPTPAPPAGPVAGSLKVVVTAPLRDRGRPLALRGDRVRVKGTLKPFVAGQKVTVRVRAGKRKLFARVVKVRDGGDGTGRFTVTVPARRSGAFTIRAVHRATKQMRTVRSRGKLLLVATPAAAAGSRGAIVRLFQRRLVALHYLRGASGIYDPATERAVMAWRKVNGRARTFSADSQVIRSVLKGRGAWHVRHPGAGHHVEADISLQALALIDGDRVVRVIHTSSGAPATPTVQGTFHFYSKSAPRNLKGMVFSNYFIGGYAIHGYFSVPPYNASHGCLRIPVPDAPFVFGWVRLGDTIFVEP